jgi:hypothetical protein
MGDVWRMGGREENGGSELAPPIARMGVTRPTAR